MPWILLRYLTVGVYHQFSLVLSLKSALNFKLAMVVCVVASVQIALQRQEDYACEARIGAYKDPVSKTSNVEITVTTSTSNLTVPTTTSAASVRR